MSRCPFFSPRVLAASATLCLPLCLFAQVPKSDAPARPVKAARTASGPSQAAAESNPVGYRIEPAASWVIASDDASTAPVEKAPMHYRVIDDQERVDGKSHELYTHLVRIVDDPSGLAVASQLEVEFDPSYQTLVVHRIDVVRDGKRSTRLDRRKVQLLHRETQLERQTYDGRITFSLAMDDVRSGDTIDIAYTVRGANPVFEGRNVDVEWLISPRGPVQLFRYRLLAPVGRPMTVRAMPRDAEISSRDLGPLRETTVLRRSTPLFRPETGATSRALLTQQLWISEFGSWQDVAIWGRALFDEAGRPMPGVDLKAAEIGAANSGKEARLLAALDFVQKDIRYFATEAGPNSHRPVDPEQVMQKRFGDCKDKVGLLLALLRRLDMPAEPLLVSASMHARVADVPPTPLAFDHVIARVALGEHVYWLDATRGHQTGVLEARQSAAFGKGLLLNAGTTTLTDLPSLLQTRRIQVDDKFVVEKFGTPPVLESRVTYRGDFAEAVRDSLATSGAEATRARMTEVYARLFPKLKSIQEPAFESSPDEDAVVLIQRFSVPEFWKFPEQRLLIGQVGAWAVADALRTPQAESRRDALGLGAPGIYSQHISIHYPVDVFDKTKTETFDEGDAYFAVHTKVEYGKNGVDIQSDALLKAEELPAADWASHQTHLRNTFPKLSGNLILPPIPIDKAAALTADAKALLDSLRDAPAKARTKVQVESSLKALVLNYEINAGRLEPPFLAEALLQRGVVRDQMGLFDAAAPDFERAVELSPDNKAALNGAAVNASMRNRTADVIRFTDPVLLQSPDDVDALNSRMLSKYLAKDYAGAAAERDKLLQSDAGWRRGYPVVLSMLIDRRSGRTADAAALAAHESDLPSDWPRQLVDWSQGKIDADALLAAARQGSVPGQRLCEAYFYLGEKADADGDKARAVKYFKQAADQGVTEFVEDHLAHLRLDARS